MATYTIEKIATDQYSNLQAQITKFKKAAANLQSAVALLNKLDSSKHEVAKILKNNFKGTEGGFNYSKIITDAEQLVKNIDQIDYDLVKMGTYLQNYLNTEQNTRG